MYLPGRGFLLQVLRLLGLDDVVRADPVAPVVQMGELGAGIPEIEQNLLDFLAILVPAELDSHVAEQQILVFEVDELHLAFLFVAALLGELFLFAHVFNIFYADSSGIYIILKSIV